VGWSETTSGRAGQRRCRSTLRRHAAAALRQSLAALAILPIKAGKQPLRLRLDARRSRSTLLPNLPAAPLVHPLLIEPMQTPQTEERRPERFAAYIAARRFDPPRSLLIRAADLAESKDHALDAGAGALNATRYLLSAGFKHVTALDSSPVSQTVAAELRREQVRFVLSRFEDYDYPDRAYEFVNAEFSLPFISAAAFPSVFTKLMASVKIGGLYTGQLFGPNDSWNLPESGMNFHSRSDVERLLHRWTLLELTEEEIARAKPSSARTSTGTSSISSLGVQPTPNVNDG